MRSSLKWLALAVIAIGGAGCVSQVQHDQLKQLYRTTLEQVNDLQAQLADKERIIISLREAAAANDTRAELAKAIKERDELRSKLADFETRLRNLGKLDNVLSPELTGELQKLADANPGLLTFDAKRGMIKLSSDLTFELGSTKINAQAAAALTKLAAILNEQSAAPYEAMIVGHTDNVPIGRPETLKEHPTNWHLSVHRAIAVEKALEHDAVSPERMSVAGYGQYRPIVPNSGSRGAPANRRVEIFLVPSTATGLHTAGAPEEAPPAVPPTAPPRTPVGPRPGDEMYK